MFKSESRQPTNQQKLRTHQVIRMLRIFSKAAKLEPSALTQLCVFALSLRLVLCFGLCSGQNSACCLQDSTQLSAMLV